MSRAPFPLTRHLIAHALLFAGSAGANPSAGGTGTATLDVVSDGDRVHLLTTERMGDGKARLLHHRSDDGGATWSEPRPIDTEQPPPHSPHRGFDPQVAASGDTLVAAWTTGGTDRWGSGPIATALSDDGGRTWRAGPNPADDGLTAGHGFLDLAAGPEGTFHLVWLDSRDGRQGLRHAKSGDGGLTWSRNLTLQAGTCECCRNTLALDASGNPAVLFRDHDPRDMKVVFTQKSEWSKPLVAGAFGWKFEGCPHAGGGLAWTSAGLRALVWTGSETHLGVHFVAPLEGTSRRLGGPSAIYPDLAATFRGALLAVWQEPTEEGAVINHTLSDDGGETWTELAAVPGAGGAATHPLVVATGSGFVIAWTEHSEGEPGRWAAHRIALTSGGR